MKIDTMVLVPACVLGVLLGLPNLGATHHSRAGVYDTDTRLEMQGVVAEWRWRNPHVFLVWDVRGGDGSTVRWVGELSSVTTMMSEGIGRNSFREGEAITVTVAPARAGTPQGQLIKVVLEDGSVPLDRTGRPLQD